MNVLLGFALAWLVFVVLHRLFSGRFWLWLLPDLIPPVSYVAVPLVLLAISVPAAQHWTTAVALSAGLLGVGHSGLNRHGLVRSASGPGAVRVLSWNTEYWDQADTAKGLYEFLKAKNADIYVLQECLHGVHVDPRPVADLRLDTEFPEYHIAAAGELVTLSRFPIVSPPTTGTSWRTEYDTIKMLRTDIQLDNGILSVYNVHIPVQFVRDDKVFTRDFYTRLRQRNLHRKAQFDGLRADIEANPNPVLVTGDFNSTGAMGDLRWLRNRLTSANSAARRCWPASWPAHGMALWQLDWTFTRGLRVHRYEFHDPHGISDHRTQELHICMGGTNHDRSSASAAVSAGPDQ
ncbi:endonuclease/exonuclease/phosphatase family protein [Actinocrispum sp. NPDC049592]|uniref:endonuclease/exonuclease/phosphatase family protein n=1 Tax=Actinocrispum sp. NPDC049592 TaxID=3154835 RepID=UPI00343AE3E2